MSFWFGTAQQEDQSLPGAGGEATLGAIASAAYYSAKHVDSTLSAQKAQEDAIDRRNAAIFADTGIKVDNPFRTNVRTPSEQPGRQFSGDQQSRIRQYEERLKKIAEQHPQARDTIRAGSGVLAMGIELARESDAQLAKVMESRSGVGKWAAVMAGAAGAIPHDPLQVLSLGLGGELSVARTIWGAIGKTALKEALINGASEAVLQPFVQDWREQAGLDHGFDQGLNNVLMAAGIGGAFGVVAGGVQAAVRPRLSGPALDAAAASASPRLKGRVAEALNGDERALAPALEPVRDALPADARGALDAALIEDHSLASKPARTTDADHANAIRAMQKRVDAENALMDVPVDQERVSRLAALEYTAAAPSAPVKGKAHTVTEFIMAHGGMKDEGGELSAMGASGRGKAFLGRLVAEDGQPLDRMREAVAEAGYFTERYGSTENAMTRSTINDLLDVIDTELRGKPVWSSIDMAEGRVTDDVAQTLEQARAQAARHFEAVLREGGPGLDDDLVRAAAKLHAEGLDAGTAIEKAAIELGDIKAARGQSAFADDIPGFEPDADGIDDVPQRLAAPEDYDMLTPEEVAAFADDPAFEGVDLRATWEDALADEDLAMLLDSCRLR